MCSIPLEWELASLVKMPGKSEPDPESTLVRRLKTRDGRAMVDLYDRYGRLLYSVILRAVNDSATAEDLLQETLMRVWNRIHTFDETKGRLEGWLVTVARNRALDHLRANQTSPLAATADLEDLERAGMFYRSESHADRIAQENAVNAALGSLNKDQRQVIELIHFEGLTQAEIAAKLGRPLGTVKGMVRSALKCLRTAMAGGVS